MELSDLIEQFIQYGIKAYKKLYRCTPEGRAIDRHEPVEIKGVDFSYWRELSVYKMAEYLKEICPECEIEVTLEGNNSELKISVDDNEYEKIVEVINKFLEENKL